MLNKYVEKENKKALDESGKSEIFNLTNGGS